MIEGASDVTRMFDVVRKLGIADMDVDVTRGATYAINYKGQDMRIQESVDAGEEFDDLTEEELRIMSNHDKSYDRWYDEKLNDIAANVLLGLEDKDE